jgi:hypothetical protein
MRESLEASALITVADDTKMGSRDAGKRPNRDIEALLPSEAPNGDEHRVIARRPGQWAKESGVDTIRDEVTSLGTHHV